VDIMRKRLTPAPPDVRPASDGEWLDLEQIAQVEVTSEDVAHPVEAALMLTERAGDEGWRAAGPGPQRIRLLFDEPQRLRRIWLHVVEPADERTQEFVLRWSPDGGRTFRDVVRQQWHFAAPDATSEIEDYRVDLGGVTVLEFAVTPDIGGGSAPASLLRLRVA
jgi:hypothetical protein